MYDICKKIKKIRNISCPISFVILLFVLNEINIFSAIFIAMYFSLFWFGFFTFLSAGIKYNIDNSEQFETYE